MNDFINRNRELRTLTKEYERNKASLVIIYGRRRVGKTTLIKQFIKDKDALYFLATEEGERENRISFKNRLGEHLNEKILIEANDLDWSTIIDKFITSVSDRKKILIIDEFQYLGKSNKAFPSIFQKIWDMQLQDENVMVILCGSMVSMMISQTLNYTSPLYGRRTAQIHLQEIDFYHYAEFFSNGNNNDLVEKYAITGGIPKYIDTITPFSDYEECIHEIVTNRDLYLRQEAFFLLSNEVKQIGSYYSLLKVIADGNVKPGDISSVLETRQPNLIHYLRILQDLGYIKRIVPVTEKNPQKSKRVIYNINDKFLQFWFRFIYPNLDFIEMESYEYVLQKIRRDFIQHHVSYVYEDICRQYIKKNMGSNLLPEMYNKIGTWWDNDTEVDILAVNEEEEIMLVCECKYRSAPAGINEYRKLKAKSHKIRFCNDSRMEKYVLFSKSGFTQDLINYAEDNGELIIVKYP